MPIVFDDEEELTQGEENIASPPVEAIEQSQPVPTQDSFTFDQPIQQQDSTSNFGTMFPSTEAEPEPAINVEESIQGRPTVDPARMSPEMMDDVLSFSTRATEGLKRMFSGGGVEGFLSALQDPEAGVFQESRQDAQAFWTDKVNQAQDPVSKKLFQTLGFLGTAGYGVAEDPLGFVSGGVKGVAKKFPQKKISGVPSKELISPEGIPLSPAQAKGLERSNFEAYAQANPFTQDIPQRIKDAQLDKLEDAADKISKSLGGQPGKNIEKSVRGNIIESKVNNFKNITSKQFGAGEELIRSITGDMPVNFRTVDVLGPSKSGLVDAAGKPINVVNKVTTTNATDAMDGYLKSIGHEIGDPITNVAGIGDNAIKKALKYRTDIKGAQTINELLNVKKNISNEVFANVKEGIFTGDRDIKFLRGINGRLNNSIEESIKAVSPGVMGEDLAGVFRSINKSYGDNLDALMSPSKKLGLGKSDFRPEDVVGKIKLLGSKNLKKLKIASQKKPEVKAIYEELQRGGYEDVLSKSMNYNTMQISPDKFSTNWNKLDKGIKEALFPPNITGEIDKLVKTYQKVTVGDLSKLNPSGTAKINFLTKVARNPVDAFSSMLSYLPVKHYYKTGKLPQQSIMNLMRSSGDRVYMTVDKLKRIRQASSLGQFLRASQKEDK